MSTQSQPTQVLLPVGRILQGDLYEAQTKDHQGNPLTIKTGPNAGQPTQRYYFALGIKKTPGVGHWSGEPALKPIWERAHADWPQMIDPTARYITSKKFAWKIEDGDSTEPDESVPPRRNCDKEGFPGCWVVKLSSSFATKIFNSDGTQPLVDKNLVKRGFYVEVLASVQGNGNTQNPGIYINHVMVAYRAPGDEIRSGPDPKAVGFGKAGLPAGVSTLPGPQGGPLPPGGHPAVGAGAPAVPGAPAAGVPAMPAGVGAPGFPGAPAGSPIASPALTSPSSGMPAGAPTVPQTAVQPHAGILNPPGAPVAPAAPPPPPAGPVMTAAAGGAPWSAFVAQGWTEATARAAGYIV